MSSTYSVVSDDTAWEAVPPGNFLRRYCKYAATQTDAAVAFHVMVGLTILASLVPREITTYRNGKKQQLNLYALLVGDSVLSRKTTAIDIGLSVAQEVLGDTIIPPPDSWQGLLAAIQAAPRPQVLVTEPEFSRFLSQAGERGYLGALKLGYTEIYDGGSVGRRTKDMSVQISGASVSLLAGCAQVHIESHMTLDDFTGGFWARFMIVQADAGAYRPHNEPKPEMLAWLKRYVQFLTDNIPAEWKAPMTVAPEAAELIGNYGAETNARARKLPPTSPRRGVVGRAQLILHKVAALLAFDRHMMRLWDAKTAWEREQITSLPITILPEDVIFAERIAQIHLNSACAVANSIASTPAMRNRRRVLEVALAAEGAVTDGYLAAEAQLLIRDLRPIIETLMAQGLLIQSASADLTVRYTAAASAEELAAARRTAEAVPPTSSLANLPVPLDAAYYGPGQRMNEADGERVYHGGDDDDDDAGS